MYNNLSLNMYFIKEYQTKKKKNVKRLKQIDILYDIQRIVQKKKSDMIKKRVYYSKICFIIESNMRDIWYMQILIILIKFFFFERDLKSLRGDK